MKLSGLQPQMVFKFFEEISAIPRGSENMSGIAGYCMDFAASRSLKAVRDKADNVIIYKGGTAGYENAGPIILQGHLDIVCQKEEDCDIDFLRDGPDIYTDGDFITARGTTLGADNGIAVAMILSVLDSNDIAHPPIEAVFTTDEEIGMIGAMKLDMGLLSGRRMINLDAEEDDTLTVSCAGGSDFRMCLPISRTAKYGKAVSVVIKGLRGGHSGVEINSGRVNANILMGRFLNHIKDICDFDIISVNGGDKGNAIPLCCTAQLLVKDTESFAAEAQAYLNVIKNEISEREPAFSPSVTADGYGEYPVLTEEWQKKLIFAITCAPNGVMEMSAEINGLVETSLNLGILKTAEDSVLFHFTLRSNKKSALMFLEEKMKAFSIAAGGVYEAFGHYPPWEFNNKSELQKIYKKAYFGQFGKEVKVEAIHAGLECGIFSSKINGLDCIAIGPALFDVHTVNERLSISSTEQIYNLLVKILADC